jgi:2'-hydroxyisoflavone reductase
MTITRRDMLRLTLGTGAAWGLMHSSRAFGARTRKKILILGGTSFVGPAIVERAVERGHTVTLFNRGKTNPHLFPALEKLRGNRFPELDQGLTALRHRRWDVVIDTCGYFPRVVRASAELLRGNVSHYVFISTIAVYADYKRIGIREDYPLRTNWDPADETDRSETYAARKVFCEKVVTEVFPNSFTIPRSTSIIGPRNPVDASRYWAVRFRRGGEILAPGDGADPVQYMDVRDLARWVIHAAEQDISGIYNTVGPGGSLTMKNYLLACKKTTRSTASITWVSLDFIKEHKLRYRTDLPLWSPRSRYPGFMQIDNSKAIANGLRFSSVEDTISADLDWFNDNFPTDYEFGLKDYSGLTEQRERELLSLWHSRMTTKQ